MDGLQKFIDTFFDLPIIGNTLLQLLKEGLLNTLLLSVLASVVGAIVGIVIAMGRMSRTRFLRYPSSVYVDVLRGLPHILSVYLIGQGLPLAGLDVFGHWTYGYAILAIGLMEGAYMAEIFRSGFQGVDAGIVEASRSLGVSRVKTMWLVVIPIGVRSVLPALTGQVILVIKSTALIYLLGLAAGQREMFAIAQDETLNNASLSPLIAAGLLYLCITIPMTRLVNAWDARTSGLRAEKKAPKGKLEVQPA